MARQMSGIMQWKLQERAVAQMTPTLLLLPRYEKVMLLLNGDDFV